MFSVAFAMKISRLKTFSENKNGPKTAVIIIAAQSIAKLTSSR